VVEPTHLKNMMMKLDHETPIFGVTIKRYLKPPPGKHVIFEQASLLQNACQGTACTSAKPSALPPVFCVKQTVLS